MWDQDAFEEAWANPELRPTKKERRKFKRPIRTHFTPEPIIISPSTRPDTPDIIISDTERTEDFTETDLELIKEIEEIVENRSRKENENNMKENYKSRPLLLVPNPEKRKFEYAKIRDSEGRIIPSHKHGNKSGKLEDPRKIYYTNSLELRDRDLKINLKQFKPYSLNSGSDTNKDIESPQFKLHTIEFPESLPSIKRVNHLQPANQNVVRKRNRRKVRKTRIETEEGVMILKNYGNKIVYVPVNK